ncbi:cellulose biosynthesis cyclic di-GMP-binding regulatory protein BcsB [Aldersonia sp. NBC_00410]|uniref:cellulose biosynthesis cyclic di-GMP-binding regulatory protein BcsB n=1 Tax=Aldersonia sp. NBC_00410 TaxID=2975954 RepID=UPI00224E3103|nr:cellulose biosynthesis cyclic di-GMP-binding regulatory protein BcsB [Aldersonia sp. NBC_00410]MCX5042040.1 cellulose biosynthesis cyclic di-GMP-binding regulatory protein BcsB [Aldersonia sp. NBC_00410]
MSTVWIATVLAVLSGLFWVSDTISAGAAPGPIPRDVSLPFQSLGLGTTVTVLGSDASRTVAIPVPNGLTPITLRANAQLPAEVGRATVEVLSNGRVLDRAELPRGVASVPVSLSLRGVPVVDSAASVQIRSTMQPIDSGWCPDDWEDQGVALLDPVVDYAGAEIQPTTVSEFLPPTLSAMRIYVPPQPSRPESDAALELGAAMDAKYTNAKPTVTLSTLPPGTLPAEQPGLLERRIAIREADNAAVTLENAPGGPVLTITGRGDALLDQARLLSSDLSSLAVATSASVGTLDAAPIYGPQTTTVSSLGQTSLSATGVGRVRVRIGIDQTRLARPSGSVRLHLTGNYTPLPQTQNGQLTVSIGDNVIDHWPTTAEGTIDRWIDLPDELLDRYTEVVVTLDTVGATTCGTTQPVTLTIDPDSVVTSDQVTPPSPAGFRALPQALMPKFQVGLSTGDFANLNRAFEITLGLQGTTSMPLRPELVDYDTALGSSLPAVVIAVEQQLPQDIPLPIRTTGEATIEVTGADGETESIDVPDMSFGSLQAAWDDGRGRMLVAATSADAPGSVDRILDWFAADTSRWGTVDGNVVLQTADKEPFAYGAEAAAAPAADDGGLSTAEKIVIAIGAAALVVGIVIALAVVFRRRHAGRDSTPADPSTMG